MLEKKYKNNKDESIQEELESLGSSLGKAFYDINFEVPEGFFQDQQDTLLKQIAENKIPKKTKFYQFWPVISSVAAVGLLLIWLNVGNDFQPEASKNITLEDIDVAVLEEYLLDQADALDIRISLNETFYNDEFWVE